MPSLNISFGAVVVHWCNVPHSLLPWPGVDYIIDEVGISEWAYKANSFLYFSWDPTTQSKHIFCTAPLYPGFRKSGSHGMSGEVAGGVAIIVQRITEHIRFEKPVLTAKLSHTS